MNRRYFSTIGQDSHAFLTNGKNKPCIVGGLTFSGAPGLDADSDGDVIFHAICNAITSATHVPILGKLAIELCHQKGIRDSAVYLQEALKTLGELRIEHVSLTVEGLRPKFQKRADELRESVALQLGIQLTQVGVTFTSGDGMTSFGKGEGLQCFCILSFSQAV